MSGFFKILIYCSASLFFSYWHHAVPCKHGQHGVRGQQGAHRRRRARSLWRLGQRIMHRGVSWQGVCAWISPIIIRPKQATHYVLMKFLYMTKAIIANLPSTHQHELKDDLPLLVLAVVVGLQTVGGGVRGVRGLQVQDGVVHHVLSHFWLIWRKRF